MRVLVFAHIPPPHHGQSYMVQLMLENTGIPEGKGGEELIFCHINAKLSENLEDIGSWRLGKLILLLGYIVQAWWTKLTQSPELFYYVPAPAKRSALYRDWLVLFFVAPLFRTRIFHWHSIGLGEWVKEGATRGLVRRMEASVTRWFYFQNELSIVLTENGRRDIEIFSPRRVVLIPNGTPDVCPAFTEEILPQRLARMRQRQEPKAPPFELLFLAHATRTKGLFDAVEGVARANSRFAAKPDGPRIRLTVAGAFLNCEEETLFNERILQDDLVIPGSSQRAVKYLGYIGPQEKDRLLRDSDALCFASYFPNEAQPVSVIEALAYGLPVLLSRWRGLPEMVPASLAHLAEPKNSESLAEALPTLLHESRFEEYRKCYLDRYSLAKYRDRLREAFFSAV